MLKGWVWAVRERERIKDDSEDSGLEKESIALHQGGQVGEGGTGRISVLNMLCVTCPVVVLASSQR